MKLLNVTQGSPDWVAARAQHFCASEAPVMMGTSKHTTRTDLVRMKATGDEKEFSRWQQQNLLDKGHEAEAAARALVEAYLGQELYPATGTDDSGRLLASFDGITMDDETGWEHKLYNEELAAAVRAQQLPPSHYWQLEHQALVGGLKRIIFVCSDGTSERFAQMEYRPVPGRAEQLLAGWKQFEEDVANYQHVEVLPRAIAEPIMALPALSIQVNGAISLISNLDLFGRQLKVFIEGIDKNPSDDQAFANAEAAVKTLKTAQDALEAAEASALGQTASIDEMRRTVGMYKDLARTTRLTLEKLVEARKQTIRDEIRRGGADALAAHINNLNTRLGKPYMPAIPADFAGVMKGKKTIASLRDAVNTELARAKIEANATADRIDINLNALSEFPDYGFLFADVAQIATKAHDDFLNVVKMRVTEHKAAEQKRLDADRERIRQEEAAKAEAVARAKAEQEARASFDALAAQGRQAQAAREEDERKTREAREAEERQRKAERDAEEAKQREQQRIANEELGAREMLRIFVERFGHRKEFAGVVREINKLTAKPKIAA